MTDDMVFTSDDVRPAKTRSARDARYRQTHPQERAEWKRNYRHNNSKWQTDAKYLSRPICVWDGEGITRANGQHDYVMLACKSNNGHSDYEFNARGLSTAVCFDMLLDGALAEPDAIHAIYGGSYDFNMMMRDIPREDVDKIYHNKFHVWQGYRIGWRAGKSFYVCRVDAQGNKIGPGITIYDVVSFFQCTFVKACDEYLGDRFEHRDMIVANKAARGSFTDADVPKVREYNDAELDNLIALITELRARLNAAGLRPKRWDGPGAVAAALLTRERVRDAQGEMPMEVQRAARFAYAGGRFEVLKFGKYTGPVWEYDVNSAYPSALRNVPNLNAGKWRHVTRDPGPQPFALYRVEWSGASPHVPGPLFVRYANGTIAYPTSGSGWYWSPEVDVAREYAALTGTTVRVREAYVFDEKTGTPRPFAFIEPLYRKRKALKKAGDGAHVGIKLALNSLYGKLAQQVGAERRRDGTWRIPPFHQLEWAGYTTSWCRATVLRAVLPVLDSVIAFETDAVFVDAPLDVKIGEDLGDFEPTEFVSLTYTQSGMYYATLRVPDKNGKTEVARTRGVDRGYLTRESAEHALSQPYAADRYVSARLTRFVGAGIALAQDWARWQRWERKEKNMKVEPSGKRMHGECWCMVAPNRERFPDGLHITICPFVSGQMSEEFPVVWANPNPAMTMLEELREREGEWE